MKLSELKTGMVVELRNGDKYLVVNNYFISYKKHMLMSSHNEDMSCIPYKELDIVKVWEQKQLCNMYCMFETDWLDENRFGHLIWDIKNGDCIDMTMEEICKALGKNVRIVESH